MGNRVFIGRVEAGDSTDSVEGLLSNRNIVRLAAGLGPFPARGCRHPGKRMMLHKLPGLLDRAQEFVERLIKSLIPA